MSTDVRNRMRECRNQYVCISTTSKLPVCLIKNDDFVTSFWQSHFLHGKHLDFIANNINTSETVQEQNKKNNKYCLFIFIKKLQHFQ